MIVDMVPVQDIVLRGVIADLMTVCNLLNNSRKSFRLDPYVYQEVILSVCYRLLHRCPLAGAGFETNNDNIYHLGLLALMTTMLFQNGHSKRISYNILAKRLRNTIESLASIATMEDTTLLWLLFVSGISIFNITGNAWMLPEIKKCTSKLGIESWRTARDRIRTRPWIYAVHDKLGEQLWQAAMVT